MLHVTDGRSSCIRRRTVAEPQESYPVCGETEASCALLSGPPHPQRPVSSGPPVQGLQLISLYSHTNVLPKSVIRQMCKNKYYQTRSRYFLFFKNFLVWFFYSILKKLVIHLPYPTIIFSVCCNKPLDFHFLRSQLTLNRSPCHECRNVFLLLFFF